METVFTLPDRFPVSFAMTYFLSHILLYAAFGSEQPDSLVAFEVLHIALVLFGLIKRRESAQVATFASIWILLLRIQTELSGFEFADHAGIDARTAKDVAQREIT